LRIAGSLMQRFLAWAEAEDEVRLVLLVGSRAREERVDPSPTLTLPFSSVTQAGISVTIAGYLQLTMFGFVSQRTVQ
jgi:hypothetical protein